MSADATHKRAAAAGDRAVFLEARALRAAYGRAPVLGPLDLSVHEGEIVGILGHNGMGKTTLLRTLMGQLPASGGQVLIDGDDWTHRPVYERARAGIGYVPQGRGILPALSARENLEVACIRGVVADVALPRVLALLPRVQAMLDRPGGSLSGGEQQILALARALMIDPWLLLLDEPTEGIQPSIVEEMAATLARLRDSQGLTIVVVEQNLDFLLDCANRLLVLERGRFVDALGPAEMRDAARMDALSQLGAARATRGGATARTASHDTPAPTQAHRPTSGSLPLSPSSSTQPSKRSEP